MKIGPCYSVGAQGVAHCTSKNMVVLNCEAAALSSQYSTLNTQTTKPARDTVVVARCSSPPIISEKDVSTRVKSLSVTRRREAE